MNNKKPLGVGKHSKAKIGIISNQYVLKILYQNITYLSTGNGGNFE